MLRVLQVIGTMNVGGAETMLMNIYRCLNRSKLQFDFLVFSEEKQDYEDEIVGLGGKVIHFPVVPSFSPIKTARYVRAALNGHGPYDVIHDHTLINSLSSLLACIGNRRIMRVMHAHTTGWGTSGSLMKKIYEFVALRIIRIFSDKWLACSEEAGQYLFGKKFQQKGTIFLNGINLQNYIADYTNEVQKLKSEYQISNNELIIGSVARLVPEKNHAFMLCIARKLKEQGVAFRMFFAGKGCEELCLKQKNKEYDLEDHVIFLGLRRDIAALLNMFDVFLMTSTIEGAGLVLVEAQACELPCVISSTIPDVSDLSVGLIRKCDLAGDIEDWLNMLRCHNRKVIKQHIDIESAIANSGYSAENSARLLEELYTN